MKYVLTTTQCQCKECQYNEKFEEIDKEMLLNLITHNRVDEKRAKYLTSRVGSKLCRKCFSGNHEKANQYRLIIYSN